MMVRRFLVAVTFMTLVSPDLADAACTRQKVLAKGAQLGKLVKAKMSTDPVRGRVLMAKAAPITKTAQVQMVAGGSVDLDKVCGEFDQLIAQAK
jgi:hypothetical protein